MAIGSAGKVRYNWSASDTASVGTYEGEFEVTFADSTIETFPNSGFFSIIVTDDLAGNKYTFDGTNWEANPDWIDPDE